MISLTTTATLWAATIGVAPVTADSPKTPELIQTACDHLLAIQEEGGAWPYEGVYRVKGEIPIGYRVGGTALVSEALLQAIPQGHDKFDPALVKAMDYILTGLDHPLMQPSRRSAYDVRVWGHACALQYLCTARASKRFAGHAERMTEKIRALVGALVFEELDGGGWNYAGRRKHAAFVTAVVSQALLTARTHGETVPTEVLSRARDSLLNSRVDSGAYFYSGTSAGRMSSRAKIQGSIGRSPLCETTLSLLGGGDRVAIRASLESFFEHWNELEKRRAQHGTHEPPFGVAPYYFYFAHRYAGQAIEMLPEKDRAALRARLLDRLLATRSEDGTWNDRVFPRSRNYGTAMSVMALLGSAMPIPKAVDLPVAPAVHEKIKTPPSAL
jgi:hypothetical protein